MSLGTMEAHQPKVVRFVTPLNYPKIPKYSIVNKDGNTVYVVDADLIRLLSEGLKVQYEVVKPLDVSLGARQPDGNWTGILGMITRSEADLAMGGIYLTEERYEAMNFTFPHILSSITFMTDKPQPLPKNLAIFYPFTYEIWITLFVFFAVVSVVFYFMMERKKSLQSVLLITLGSVFEQSLSFQKKTNAFRMLTYAWILGVMILSYGYKAVLLWFLSIPTLSGIEDISDLSVASTDWSFKCISPGSFYIRNFMESNSSRLRNIAECMSRTGFGLRSPIVVFQTSGPGKAVIAARDALNEVAHGYFISKDSFYTMLQSIPFSRKLCCPNRLKAIIFRITASGLLDKLRGDSDFRSQLQRKLFESNISETAMTVHLDDVSGAFYILLSGWLLSFIVFFAEIAVAKCSYQ